VDYFIVKDCADCEQATLDACSITTIAGKDGFTGDSLGIYNCPQFTSIAGLGKIAGGLEGGLDLEGMDGITTMEGLEQISSVGTDLQPGASIQLNSNYNLENCLALHGTRFAAGTLRIAKNPALACVPAEWPELDMEGSLVRNSKCTMHGNHAWMALSLACGIAVIAVIVAVMCRCCFARPRAGRTPSAAGPITDAPEPSKPEYTFLSRETIDIEESAKTVEIAIGQVVARVELLAVVAGNISFSNIRDWLRSITLSLDWKHTNQSGRKEFVIFENNVLFVLQLENSRSTTSRNFGLGGGKTLALRLHGELITMRAVNNAAISECKSLMQQNASSLAQVLERMGLFERPVTATASAGL
jgi:hypothetical protein